MLGCGGGVLEGANEGSRGRTEASLAVECTPSVLRLVWIRYTSSGPRSSWQVLPNFSRVGRKPAR